VNDDDLGLLRRFEPVVCYTQGEQFFPTAIDGYVRRASLWAHGRGRSPRRLVKEGELDLAGLAGAAATAPGAGLHLRFTDQPLDVTDYQRWRRERPAFHAPGRLARVGLPARIIDALFNVSLLVRGRVPGGATATAAAKYRAMQDDDPRFIYYGRVTRCGGYIALNYWFFYAMNPWRSGFYGANDHEGDWEQIFVYLSEEGAGEPVPLWVAYAQHDFAGDDLRRRWDDPELRRVGDHPVVFAGAGSHASYFEPGEYLMGVELAALRPVRTLVTQARRFWAERLGQGDTASIDQETKALFSIPFVDYARGDGLRVGPGESQCWSPVLLTEQSSWAEQYRGLWGLDTGDPFGGERAPAGPKYNRDGSIRSAWYDPLGWAGLDKVSPPGASRQQLASAIAQLEQERVTLAEQIDRQRSGMRSLALEQRALEAAHADARRDEELQGPHRARREDELEAGERELHELTARASALDERLEASRAYQRRLADGERDDPQAHIRHKHRPEPPLGARAWLIDVWAALSGAVLLATLGALVVVAPAGWPLWALLVLGAALLIEAAAQHRLIQTLLNATIALAIVTALIVAKDFWQLVVIAALIGLLVMLMVQNLAELRRT
jgi:hypothetical protein